MADTYAELQDEIQRWLDNDNANFISHIPLFIGDAENWIGRHLHTRDMECIATTPLSPAGADETTIGIYDLPSDWGGSKSVSIKTQDSGDLLQLHYFAKIPVLSDANNSNWLLQKYPDIYRYASLASAEAYLKNDERVALWNVKASSVITEIMEHDEHDLYSGGPFQIQVGEAFITGTNNGRLEKVLPYQFIDYEAGNATLSCKGIYTLTQTKIRIFPKPELPS